MAKFVTLAHYEDDLEIPTTPDFLIPVENILHPQEAPQEPQPTTEFQAPQWRGVPADKSAESGD